MPKRKSSPEEKIRKLEKKLKKFMKDKDKKEMEDEESVQELTPIIDVDPEINFETGIPEIPEDTSDVEESLIAEALGEPPKDEAYSEDIHPNLASQMESILEKGLTKAEKEKLIDIKVPGNCKLLDAPKLNVELSGILTLAAKTRDKLLQERLKEIGQSAGNIAQAIQNLSKKEFSKTDIIKKLGEASRLICNLHYQYTDIRRKLINPFLDKSLTENLKENKRGADLYSNLEESVKSFSAIKRASNLIKPKTMSGNKTGNSNYNNTNAVKHPKNYQQPRRQYQNNHNKRGAYHQHQRTHQHQQQAYKPSDRRSQTGPSNRGRAKYP